MLGWDWFNALYSLSIYFVILNFIWKYASIPIGLIFLVFTEKVQGILDAIVWVIPYYLLTSLAVIVVLGFEIKNGQLSIFISIICIVFLIICFVLGIAQSQSEFEKQGYLSFNFIIVARYIFSILCIPFYIYAIKQPSIVITDFTFWFVDIIQWIRYLPIIGWIVGICSFFYAIYMILAGVGAVFALISTFTKWLISRQKVTLEVLHHGGNK